MSADFSAILTAHAARWPAMTPQDYGKLAYQNAFGPEHIIASPEAVLERLWEEWQGLPPDNSLRGPEDIGNGLCRFHLSGPADETAAGLLAELLCRTGREHTKAPLEPQLECLRTLGIPGMADWLAEYWRQGCPALSHSGVFRTAYRPHYRLLRTAYGCFFPVLLAVRRLLAEQGRAMVAVDGRCGSGKTSLAALLAELFPCRVFHMDDFYLPIPQRKPGWDACPGGNMDLERFAREVLLPAQAGETVLYRPYHCRTGQFRQAEAVPPAPLTVVEGSYSQHPALEGQYGLSVFLTCPQDVQARRLQAREGDGFPAFQSRWIPFEERYFAACGLPRQGTITVDTGMLG